MAETLEIEKPIKTVDKRNDLNDLTSTEWVQETKSFFYQKGLGAGSPEAKYEKIHPAPFSFTDITKLIKFSCEIKWILLAARRLKFNFLFLF